MEITPKIDKLLRSKSEEDNALGIVFLAETYEFSDPQWKIHHTLKILYKHFNGVHFYKYADIHWYSLPSEECYNPRSSSYYTLKEKWKNLLR